MARLPTPGGDSGTWGDILNDFLSQALNGDGSLKDSAIGSAGGLLSSNNLSDLSSVATARTNLGLGTSAVLNIDTDSTLAANSDSLIATQKATKTYVDNAVGSPTAAVILAPTTSARNTVQPTGDFIPLIAKGHATQTVNLQEWQNSGGSPLAYVNSSGNMLATSRFIFANDIDTQIYRSAADTVRIMAGSSDITQYDSSGVTLLTGSLLTSSSNTASSGAIRMANTQTIAWRNAANSANYTLGVNSSNILVSDVSMQVGTSSVSANLHVIGAGANVIALKDRADSDLTKAEFTIGSDAGYMNLYRTGSTVAVKLSADSGVVNYINNGSPLALGTTTAAGTVQKLGINAYNTVDNAAAAIITASAAAVKPLVVQAAGSQSANLQEWQNSSGTALAAVTSTGGFATGSTGTGFNYSGAGNYALETGNGKSIITNSGGGATITMDNTTMAINPYLNLTFASLLGSGNAKFNLPVLVNSSAGTLGTVEKFRVTTPTTADNAANVMLSASAAGAKPLVVQGAGSQTANLQEWQNSSGTSLASIASTGSLVLTTAATISWGGEATSVISRSASGVINIGGGSNPLTFNANTRSLYWQGNGSLNVGSDASPSAEDINFLDPTGNPFSFTFGTTQGLKIGTATNQKLGFYNSTPIIQPTGDVKTALGNLGLVGSPTYPVEIGVAMSDETTAITTGTAKVTLRAPYAFTLTAVRASLTTASSSGTPTVDINESGTTVLSTKLTIDADETTSTTAAVPPVISDSSIADDAVITFDIDVAGTGATGLKVWLIGTRA